MQCPVCKNHEHEPIDLRSGGFTEGLVVCLDCGTGWSVNRGQMAIVKDPNADTFLEALSADSYLFAAA
jgi:hypothetical protein